MYKIIAIILLFFTLSACLEQQSELHKKIAAVDSLIRNNQRDSAKIIFESLDLKNAAESEIAYYNVLAMRMGKKETKDNDSLLNISEMAFTNAKNKSILSEILMIKAKHYFRDKDIYDSAAVLLNKSEKIATDANDYYLLAQIYWLRSIFHKYERDVDKVKEDVNIQLLYAEKSKNKRQIAYATLNKAIAYKNLNMTDSAKTWLRAALLSSNEITPYDHAYIYNALGELTDEKDSIIAKDYFQKSIETFSNIPAKINLAKIYFRENNIPFTIALCNEGVQYEWPETKIEFLKLLCQCKIKEGDIKAAFDIQEKIISEKDSVLKYTGTNNQLRTSNILETFNSEAYWKYTSLFCILLLVVFVIVISKYYKKQKDCLSITQTKNNQLHEKLQDILLKNNSLQEHFYSQEKEIARVRKENDEQYQKISILEKQLNKEKQKNANFKNSGETLYNQVVNNEPIITWSTDDMVNFVEYYRTINPELVASFDNDYKKLTPRYKIILILEDLGKSTDEIKQIMSFEESSYYSAKSRINAQKTT
ncbi:MAG: hypothetical protein J6U21_08680 [Bacteroidales bacterium]|nr:hypothetical protein [Bacteroidales bacterium]